MLAYIYHYNVVDDSGMALAFSLSLQLDALKTPRKQPEACWGRLCKESEVLMGKANIADWSGKAMGDHGL